jgi:hypothetical protein
VLALLPSGPPPDPLDDGNALDSLHRGVALDSLHRGVLEDARLLRAVQVRLARRLLALRRAPSLYRFGATTFALYCETIGLSAAEGRDLASLAEAALVRPDVVPRFAEGRLSLGKVSALAHLLRMPDPEPPGTDPARDWVRTAEGVTTRDLWRLLEERREQRRLREAPEFVAMFVSRRGREDFLRCRELVSRREWVPVTEGATLERVCDTYLVRNDPERRAARLANRDLAAGRDAPATRDRRGPSFSPDRDSGHPAAPGNPRRRIPAALQRGLIRLFGDRCWVEGCDRRSFLDFAHGVPVRLGGGQEPDNLLRLCKEHHGQFDGEGWRPIPRRDGVVVLVDRRGVVVGRLRRAAGEDVR